MDSKILAKIEKFCNEEEVEVFLSYQADSWWRATIRDLRRQDEMPEITIPRNTPVDAVHDAIQEYSRVREELDERLRESD